MYESGLVSDHLKERIDNALTFFLSSPGGRAWWEASGYLYPNYQHIQNLLSDTPKGASEFDQWRGNLINGVRGLNGLENDA